MWKNEHTITRLEACLKSHLLKYGYPIHPAMNAACQVIITSEILSGLRVVVQGNTNQTTMMAVILSDNLLAVKFPQPRIVIRTSSDQIRRVRRESTIPDPSLVASQRTLQLEWLRVHDRSSPSRNRKLRLNVLHFPDLGGVVSGAGSEVFDIR